MERFPRRGEPDLFLPLAEPERERFLLSVDRERFLRCCFDRDRERLLRRRDRDLSLRRDLDLDFLSRRSPLDRDRPRCLDPDLAGRLPLDLDRESRRLRDLDHDFFCRFRDLDREAFLSDLRLSLEGELDEAAFFAVRDRSWLLERERAFLPFTTGEAFLWSPFALVFTSLSFLLLPPERERERGIFCFVFKAGLKETNNILV